jgi:hypothetical protein
MSFEMELVLVTTVQAIVNLYVPPGNTKLKYFKYSIIVVTSSTYEVELVSVLYTSPDATLVR